MTVDRVVVLDTETTGTDVENDRIVSACVATVHADGGTSNVHTWMLNPGIPIPAAASDIHGITTERAQAEGGNTAILIPDIAWTLEGALAEGDVPLVAFNAAFDITILDREFRRWQPTGLAPHVYEHVIDPYVLDKALDPFRKGKRRLSFTAAHYGVELSNAHAAEDDAIAAGHLAFRMLDHPKLAAALNEFADVDTMLDKLHAWQQKWRRGQSASLAEYMSRQQGRPVLIDPSWPIFPHPDTSTPW